MRRHRDHKGGSRCATTVQVHDAAADITHHVDEAAAADDQIQLAVVDQPTSCDRHQISVDHHVESDQDPAKPSSVGPQTVDAAISKDAAVGGQINAKRIQSVRQITDRRTRSIRGDRVNEHIDHIISELRQFVSAARKRNRAHHSYVNR